MDKKLDVKQVERRVRQLNCQVSEKQYQQLRQLAFVNNVSIGYAVREILKEYFNKE
jgi:hypothetical protein